MSERMRKDLLDASLQSSLQVCKGRLYALETIVRKVSVETMNATLREL